MSDTTNALLQQAYTLIENDEYNKAQEILAPLLEDDANNVHLWWVYTHAVQDTAIGQAALERVLALDPKYPGARELKADVLEAQAKDPDLIALEANESNAASAGAGFDVDDWEDLQPAVDAEPVSSSLRGRLVLLVLVVLIIAAGALVISGAVDLNALLSGLLPSPEPQVIVVSDAIAEPAEPGSESLSESTADEAVASLEATIELETTAAAVAVGEATEAGIIVGPIADQAAVVSADATAVATAVDEEPPTITDLPPDASSATYVDPPLAVSYEVALFVSQFADAIEDFDIDRAQSAIQSTSLGSTLVIRVCAIPGREFNDRLNALMSAAVSLAASMPEEVEAFGAALVHCGDPEANLRVIGVARRAIIEFADEEIESKDFQRAWQPLS